MTAGHDCGLIGQYVPVEQPASVEDFRDAATAIWRYTDQEDGIAASWHAARADQIADEWRASGLGQERLMLLLLDPSSEVRHEAAARLGPESSEAVRVLEALSAEPTGRIAPTSKLLLKRWHAAT